MILLWAGVGALTAVAVAAVLIPFIRRRPLAPARAAFDLAVYRDQLKELEADRAQGLMDDAAAAAARRDIERRMLAVDESPSAPGMSSPTGRWRSRAGLALIVLGLPLGALGLYARMGSPDLPAQPLGARSVAVPEGEEELARLIAGIEARLAAEPSDARGWRLLGGVYALEQRWGEAVEAFRRARALDAGDPAVAAQLGEALVRQGGNIVTPEAEALFALARAAVPDDPASLFYLGLARFQRGEPEAALELWRPLLDAAPADAPWLAEVRALAAEAARAAGLEMPPEAGDGAPDGLGQGFSERERAEIESRVASLAERLAADPDDVAGWMRLARSYTVLGRLDEARAAYAEAALRAPEEPEVLSQYAASILRQQPAGAPVPQAAVALFERLLAQDPGNPQALWFLAQAAAETGALDSARDLLDRLLGVLEPGTQGHALVLQRRQALAGD